VKDHIKNTEVPHNNPKTMIYTIAGNSVWSLW